MKNYKFPKPQDFEEEGVDYAFALSDAYCKSNSLLIKAVFLIDSINKNIDEDDLRDYFKRETAKFLKELS